METIARDSERDRMWDAQSAVDYGFCDGIVTSLEEILPQPPSGSVATSIGYVGQGGAVPPQGPLGSPTGGPTSGSTGGLR